MMHSLSFTTACCLTLCLASTILLANGQYKTSPYTQRKMAPVPTSYSAPAASEYGQEQSGYGQHQAPVKYSAPSSASTSQYDERQQAASYGAPAAAPKASYGAAPSQGYGKQRYEEPQYPPMPFAWGYDINDGYGGAQYHKENGDEYGKRTGSYGYTDAYGVYRQVDYVADEYGFRATIKTNEPGTANESPADVDLHAYEPPSNYYAGNTQSYGSSSYAAPKPASSYGKAASAYGPSAAPAYAPSAAPAYAAPKSYPRPSASQYSGPAAPMSSYGRQQSGYGAAPAPVAQYQPRSEPIYQQQQDYAGSVLVPVYQKASAGVAKKASRHI